MWSPLCDYSGFVGEESVIMKKAARRGADCLCKSDKAVRGGSDCLEGTNTLSLLIMIPPNL